MKQKIVVIGGGIGELATAALPAMNQIDVAVLEACNDLGKCAGKFQRREPYHSELRPHIRNKD
ncbi:NAD(P)-binding protein [Bacillus sp. F19]|nr:NAD(P)-binding protein [Bacillus sp. F19]